jgi:hypothetical protein
MPKLLVNMVLNTAVSLILVIEKCGNTYFNFKSKNLTNYNYLRFGRQLDLRA